MAEKTAASNKKKGPGFFLRIKNYFKELFSEIKKITWPTPKQILKSSLIVLAVVAVAAILLAGLNWVLTWAFSAIIDLLQSIK